MKLNDKLIQASKPKDAQYNLADGNGLTLVVKPNGTKLWWLRYRFAGKAKTLSLGQYPLISLKDARERAYEARKLLANDTDPSQVKKETAAAIKASAAPVQALETVEAISREWLEKFGNQWVDSHASKIVRRLERDLFPHFKNVGIASVTPASLLAVLRRVEARGALETAHRLHKNCGQIWRYAVSTGRAERDITGDLKGALPPAKETHLGAITEPAEIGKLLRNIDEYKGSAVVRLALQLAPLFFVRPGELRHAEWSEFTDFDNDEPNRVWIIPEGKMKAKRKHVVPLSRQAIWFLAELKEITGAGKYLFPSPHSAARCLSDNAILSALRRMGYTSEEMTGHGFRAMASTNLEQLGYDVRLIELQLAHADQDQVRAAYKRETHLLRLDERSKMMQHWADYLDGLCTSGMVLPFKKAR
jgi:integrase